MIAIVLGGAPGVWKDAEEALILIADRPHIVVAANLAGIHWQGRLDAFVSLHPDLISGWMVERAGSTGYRVFVPNGVSGVRKAEVLPERWPGSSGLYAVQAALGPMLASGAILCGVPMDQDAGHFVNPGPWARTTSYRLAFTSAKTLIGPRVRSMGGWTREIFGAPDLTWLDAVSAMDPLGELNTSYPARLPMHHVENVSDASQPFNVRNPQGGFQRVILKPGQSGDFDVDPNQGRFQEGGPLKVTPIDQAKPSRTRAARPLEVEAPEEPEAEAPAEPTPEEPIPAEP